MLKILLLLTTAFWGDTQVQEWGAIEAHYGLGLPFSNRLNLVEFTLGYRYIGIGASIVESYGFRNGQQFIGSLLPLHLTLPLYQKVGFWENDAFFQQTVTLKLRGSPWGQRYYGVSPLSFILDADWEAKAPYVGLELCGQWFPVRMIGLQGTFGSLVVRNAPMRAYLSLGVVVGTSGPVSQQKIGPRLNIAGAVFDDAVTGNSNGILEPNEQGRILVLVVNRGLKDADSVNVKGVVRDEKLKGFLFIEEAGVSTLAANSSTEISLRVGAGDRLPALPLRIRIWGKDLEGNLVSPVNIEIPTGGS